MRWKNVLYLSPAVLLLAVPGTAQIASAQSNTDARVERLEKEMRAVQRKVFPGGDSRYFEPEISAGGQANSQPGSLNRTGGGVTPEMLARIDSLESALQRLTGRIEEQELALADMRARLDAMGGSTGATQSRPAATASSAAPKPSAASAASSTSAAPDPARIRAVAAIEKPATDDAGDNAYSYGFRLWDAGFYPEARIALEEYLKDYPNHWRSSYGRNLLGRAWLDDGKPASSVEVFLGNYQDNPNGERAPDSLLYLSRAMTRLDQKQKACVVLEELADVYPSAANGRLASELRETRGEAGCS